ncbi:thioesterase-like superfamily-domain-containing protein [Penicillium waksmanii]|uniref:thioesterase-like superfamily-domain-containing protein n=1 Tax=Penicillium waksmanii TaxID=69791 RepID=UPI002547B3D6|nr:thioesterase-like superfamily-domain-containing protein [Penicillium waksmanii]KAJ5999868.1 thioesterase-like superfamily-domain-containing protein [Penicillium waksmanii]
MKSKSATTSFAQATKVTPILGTGSEFEANIPWDWSGETHAHGGFITSLLFSTARVYFLSNHPSRSLPDPITIHVQFLLPVEMGVARLRVDEIMIGKRYSTLQITVLNQKGSGHQSCVTAIITQGNLSTEAGQNIDVPPILSKKEIPDREIACEEWITPNWLAKLLPVSSKWRIRTLKGSKNQFLSRKGLNVKYIWMKWADEKEKLDVISLGILCDSSFDR